MAVRNMEGIEKYRKSHKAEAREKVEHAIAELRFQGKAINFNSIQKQSGVSKNFLYNDDEIRQRLEELRAKDINHEKNQRAKYDKTSKSKDVVIEAKEKRIAKLEAENKKLKSEMARLRGLLYDMK